MELNLMERLIALQLLPTEGNFATLKVMRKAKESLSLDEDEIKKFEYKQDGDQITWGVEGKEDYPIELGDFTVEALKSKLKKLDEEQKLEEKHLSLYEKIIEL